MVRVLGIKVGTEEETMNLERSLIKFVLSISRRKKKSFSFILNPYSLNIQLLISKLCTKFISFNGKKEGKMKKNVLGAVNRGADLKRNLDATQSIETSSLAKINTLNSISSCFDTST